MSSHVLTNKRSRSGYIPDYKRIEKELRERILSGGWPAGLMLPSRRELAREYRVDVNTLQRAIGPLLKDGTLCTKGNQGTFVAGSAPTFTFSPAPREIKALPTRDLPAHDFSGAKPPARTANIGVANIGIIATVDPTDLWMKAVLHSLENTLSSYGATTRFSALHYDAPSQENAHLPLREAASALLKDAVEGLIVIGIYDTPGLTEGVASLPSLTQAPIIYISWHDSRRPVHHVFYDSQFAGYQAAQHLIHLGYREFTFLAPFTSDWVEERIASARMALHDAGLSADALSLYPCARIQNHSDHHFEAGYQGFQQAVCDGLLLKGKGVIAANDRIAQGMIKAAKEIGIVAGKDFGLIGFDDEAHSLSLGLTTVRPPLEALGIEGGHLALQAVEGNRAPVQIRLHSRVIARASTCPQLQSL